MREQIKKFCQTHRNTLLDAVFAVIIALFALKDTFAHFDLSHLLLSYLWFVMGFGGGFALIYGIDMFTVGETRLRWKDEGLLFVILTAVYLVIGLALPR